MRPEKERWLLVGLGNPGPRYSGNRHNVGFMVADLLFGKGKNLQWQSSERFSAVLAKGTLSGEEVVLVKPQTYMNLSGRSVGPLARFYKVAPERVVVVHDEVDLPLGRIKVKGGGGDGGHNGLRSLSQEIGSNDYLRVRVGVGRPDRGEVADYVLSDFSPEEAPEAEEQIKRAAKAVQTLLRRGLRAAMNNFNTKAAKKDSKSKQQDSKDENPRQRHEGANEEAQ